MKIISNRILIQLVPIVISLMLSACTNDRSNRQSLFGDLPQDIERPWIGPAFWTNPLMDWKLSGGRVLCFHSGPDHDMQLTTCQLKEEDGSLKMTARMGMDEGASGNAFMGFKIAVTGHDPGDWMANLFRSRGIRIGVKADGSLLIGGKTSEDRIPLSELKDFILKVSAQFSNDTALCTVAAISGSGKDKILLTFRSDVVTNETQGNIALACEQINTEIAGSITGWFSSWDIQGTKLACFPEQVLGPLLWTKYTLHEGSLKLMAHFVPLGNADAPGSEGAHRAHLQVLKGNNWETLSTETIDPLSCTALFRINDWSSEDDVNYRVVYEGTGLAENGVNTWNGVVRKPPLEKETVSLGVFSCLGDRAFPNTDLVENVKKHDPDILFFAGDQIYENNGGYGTVPNGNKEDVPRATLNYLQKFWLWGISFRDVLKDRPAILTTDDHDVYSNDLWGTGGRRMTDGRAYGGYSGHPDWVNMVEYTQMGHLPDPPDPTPVENGIQVHFTGVKYGGISFAVLEDRKWKSAPGEILDKPIGHDNVKNMESITSNNYDPSALDDPKLQLFGERQLKFLEDWAGDWKSTDFKAVLSGSPYSICHHGYGDMFADLDGNGWPKHARDAALRVIRKGFAVSAHGDLHMAILFQNGVEDFRDAAWTYSGPASYALSQRVWIPTREGMNREKGAPSNTGDFIDGLGNKFTVAAVLNPFDDFVTSYREKDNSILDEHDMSCSGFGIIRFNKPDLTITFESWPIFDAETPLNRQVQHPGWPKTISMGENYGKKYTAWLPGISVRGMERPVIKIIDEKTGELVYARRLNRPEIKPGVFSQGTYTIEIGEEGTRSYKILKNVRTVAGSDSSILEVDLNEM